MFRSDGGQLADTFVPEDGQFDDAEADNDTSSKGEQEVRDNKETTDAGDSWFNPPLYRQRYNKVAEILAEENVKTVVDFGCSECKVLPILKNLQSLEEIIGVDLDKKTLTSGCYLTKPLLTDFLIKRPRPLRVSLLCGDAGTYDSRLKNIEAVTMIEVVEHLYPDTLEKVAHNVFVNIRPRIIVITTPNSEYNVLFPAMTGFRHWDHKFEWTREEFQDWCGPIAAQHGYTVEYSGVGNPPPEEAQLGECSQIAVFRLSEDWSPESCVNLEENLPYELITECVHPHQECIKLERTVAMDTNYYLQVLLHQHMDGSQEEEVDNAESCSYDLENNILKVSLEFLLSFSRLRKLSLDIIKYRDILISEGFCLTDDGQHVIHSPADPESSSSEETDNLCPGHSDSEESDQHQNLVDIWNENWDNT